MKTFRVTKKSDETLIAPTVAKADSLWSRFRGLMGRERLADGEGLWIEPCNSIHTFFMRFEIDVIYLDSHQRVLTVTRGMRPWRMDFPKFGARAVLELPSGGALKVTEGDILCLS